MSTEETAAAPRKSFKLLGILDVQNTPCARECVLHGSAGATVFGLSYFLFTSRVRRSCDVAMGGFIFTTLSSWFYCRYQNAKMRIQQRSLQERLRNRALYEGTIVDPNFSVGGSQGHAGTSEDSADTPGVRAQGS
ncbi:cytochrome c oxidase assembly protein COX20, mitochondrial [Lethenteron reissneri]|uniref:cytochrome c oxidase assembly protein COX20, mitochondrial n=1 Tax=Lethenteron reissneri TaxID=7753 RepID=UPI002AB5F6E4|nr:cytochrome c oxidase assembly protein COX20, mitochondrial [Lethenteron reissneri]